MALAAYCGVCAAPLSPNSPSCPSCGADTSIAEPKGPDGRRASGSPSVHNWRGSIHPLPAGRPLPSSGDSTRAKPAAAPHAGRGPIDAVAGEHGRKYPRPLPAGVDRPPASSPPRWPRLAIGALAVVAAAAAAIVLLSGGSTPAPGGPGSYTVLRTPTLTALVPSGWQTQVPSSSSVPEAARLGDPRVPGLSVSASVFPASSTAMERALAAERSAHRQPGYKRFFWGVVSFPGGLRAWRLVYAAGGIGHSIYSFSVCAPPVTVVVRAQVPRASLGRLTPQLGFVASSVRPICPPQTGPTGA
jgi:hypothetical protein